MCRLSLSEAEGMVLPVPGMPQPHARRDTCRPVSGRWAVGSGLWGPCAPCGRHVLLVHGRRRRAWGEEHQGRRLGPARGGQAI